MLARQPFGQLRVPRLKRLDDVHVVDDQWRSLISQVFIVLLGHFSFGRVKYYVFVFFARLDLCNLVNFSLRTALLNCRHLKLIEKWSI